MRGFFYPQTDVWGRFAPFRKQTYVDVSQFVALTES